MPSSRIRLSVAEARDHAERAMRGIGYDAEEAHILADHAIDAALCGYEYSGLAKLLNIPEHRRFKEPRRPIRVLRETEMSVLYDGGNNVGMLAMDHATRGAIAKAVTHSCAIVGVTNSWMSGRSAYYVEMIASADLIGIHTAGSARIVAPPGGTRPALSTNPIAFGLPSFSRSDCLRYGNLGVYGHRFEVSRADGTAAAGGGGDRFQGQTDTRSRLGKSWCPVTVRRL